MVTAAALLDTQKGPIIGVFHEYAHLGKGRSIHAAGQMEWFNCQVDDRSKIVGGAQRIETSEGYVILLSIESGLVYMHTIRIPTDQDLQNYPHVFFTSPDIWDASVLDHEITPSLLEDINQHSDDSLLQDSIFDEYGDLHHRAIQTLNIFCDLVSQRFPDHGKNSQRSHQWCSIVCTPSIDTVDQNDLVQSTSGLSGRCPEVAGGISPWIQRRSLARFHPLVFRECL